MTDKTLVTCRSVTRRFDGLVANDSIDLDVKRGEILGLIGPNGAGKSTLFNLIAGAFPVSFGVIEFDGLDITPLPAAKRCQLGIARTYQVPRSFDSMSVVENVTVGAFVRYSNVLQARAKALDVLDYVGLAAYADASAADLTPPQKRRLEVARALATEPKLLLLDEVLTGLTPSEAAAGVDLIRKVRETGVTIVMVEQNFRFAAPLADHFLVIEHGEVVLSFPAADLPAHQAQLDELLSV